MTGRLNSKGKQLRKLTPRGGECFVQSSFKTDLNCNDMGSYDTLVGIFFCYIMPLIECIQSYRRERKSELSKGHPIFKSSVYR